MSLAQLPLSDRSGPDSPQRPFVNAPHACVSVRGAHLLHPAAFWPGGTTSGP